MQYATYDFHNHTCWSYDAMSPVERVFDLADRRGVTRLAITDHHNFDAVDDVLAAQKLHPNIKVAMAAEFTVGTKAEDSIDLVCMNLPVGQNNPALEKLKGIYREFCHFAGQSLLDALQKAGYDVSYDDMYGLLKSYRASNILAIQGFTHVSWGIIDTYLSAKRGFFPTARDAFNFLYPAMPRYPEAELVMPLLRECGAVVIWAHPYLYAKMGRDEQGLDTIIGELGGIDGMECAHSEIPVEMTPFYRGYCEKRHLLSSAGTDSHILPEDLSTVKENFGPGCHIGPQRWLEEIQERVAFM